MCGAWLGAAVCELWPMQMDVLPHQRVLAVIADLIGSLPGLASDLVQGGVLRELIRLVRHPVFGCRDGDDNMAEEHSDDSAAEQFSGDNMAKETCDAILAQDHTVFMKQMVDVLRVFARQLPQVRPQPASAAVQPCMRCTYPDSTRVAVSAWSMRVPAMASEPLSCQVRILPQACAWAVELFSICSLVIFRGLHKVAGCSRQHHPAPWVRR